MSTQATIKRLSLIVELISGIHKPTKKEILEYLKQEGFKLTERTLARDFAILRDEFGVSIDYSTLAYRYFINKEKCINLNTTFQFFELSNTAALITTSLKECKDTLTYIEFEYEDLESGVNHLPKLLEAIKEKKKIEIKYNKFRTPEISNYVLCPYFLKQFQGRWYVVGLLESDKKWRSFALDRIEKIKKLPEIFERDNTKNIKDFFSNYVGVSFIDQKPETVQLWVSKEQAKYFETLPLHSSQLEIERNAKGVVFAYHLVPTYEFMQKILKEHCTVKVLKPEWLKNDVIRLLNKAVSNYK